MPTIAHVDPKKLILCVLEMHAQLKVRTEQTRWKKWSRKESSFRTHSCLQLGEFLWQFNAGHFISWLNCIISWCFLTTWKSDFIFSLINPFKTTLNKEEKCWMFWLISGKPHLGFGLQIPSGKNPVTWRPCIPRAKGSWDWQITYHLGHLFMTV